MSEFIYGFDSSLTAFGYAVAEVEYFGARPRFLAAGVLTTKPTPKTGPVKLRPTKTADHQRRFEWLATELRAVIAQHGKPSIVAVEAVALPFGKTGIVTVSALGRARGLVDGLAAEHGLSAREFHSKTLKKLMTGNPGADKPAVIAAVKGLYPELHELLGQLNAANVEHAADAVAALHAALTKEHHDAEENDEAPEFEE